MFAAGAGGAHAWEIPISTFNIYLRVGLTSTLPRIQPTAELTTK